MCCRCATLDVRKGDEIEAMPGRTESESRWTRSRPILIVSHHSNPLSFATIMNLFRNRQYTLLAPSFTCADQSHSDRQGLALVPSLHLNYIPTLTNDKQRTLMPPRWSRSLLANFISYDQEMYAHPESACSSFSPAPSNLPTYTTPL